MSLPEKVAGVSPLSIRANHSGSEDISRVAARLGAALSALRGSIECCSTLPHRPVTLLNGAYCLLLPGANVSFTYERYRITSITEYFSLTPNFGIFDFSLFRLSVIEMFLRNVSL